APKHTPKPAHSPCGQNGSLFCNDAGQCVGCVDKNDCSGQDTECQTRTCIARTCGFDFAPQGTPLASQVDGDCQVAQCDGNGANENAEENADIPVEGETCTGDVCNAGVPSTPSEPVGTSCSEGSGVVCDGSGNCAECLAPGDCPGQDTQCQTRTCN